MLKGLIGKVVGDSNEREIQKIFAGKTLRTFRNYREYQSIDYQKLGLPSARYCSIF